LEPLRLRLVAPKITVHFQRFPLAPKSSVQPKCNQMSDSNDDPLARAQARIAFHMAARQLAGRRDLRAEIRHTMIAKYVAARQDNFSESQRVSIGFACRHFKVSERTVKTAIAREAAIARSMITDADF
jgi:hypothetical protein